MKNKSPLLRSIGVGLATIALIVVYAYGFTITKINFSETRSERRIESLTRILRALAHPHIFDYNYETVDVEEPFYLGCPEGGVESPEIDRSGAFILLSSWCAEPGETITVEGYNFQANSSGPINFIGFSAEAPDGVAIPLDSFQADAQGNFAIEVKIPNRTVKEDPQALRATGRTPVGAPMISRDAKITWEKIVETVFMALLATTFGTLIAIPISFFAARNLMSDIKIPLSNIALALVGWPLGIWLGSKGNKLLVSALAPMLDNLLWILAGTIIFPLLTFYLFKWIFGHQGEDEDGKEKNKFVEQIIGVLKSLLMAIMVIGSILFVANLFLWIGDYLTPNEEVPLYFMRRFIYQIGDIVNMLVAGIAAIAGGGIVGGLFGKWGQFISESLPATTGKIVNLVITPLAGAAIAILIMNGVNWFYQFNNPAITLWWPGGIGAVLGLILALVNSPKKPLPVGIIFYGIIRTILNGTRSVEALVMAIVFVAWVGLGPFAGSLALGLHTVAALSKLYSEQVESILEGPLEAIQATGANRLQTIVFAVVPQIIPPYISFTMYRWDINVRMSTIIGFVGGGGIGFILQQNINLLNYRAASVNMLAIAIVVASMDYISSSLRERFV